MSLRLIRRLVVWATCWIALASVFYAPVEVRVRREWQPEGGHDEWLSKGHVRRPLIELLEKGRPDVSQWRFLLAESGLRQPDSRRTCRQLIDQHAVPV